MNMKSKSMTTFNVLDKKYFLPHQCDGSNRRNEILMKATYLFCQHGREGVSMRDIAREIGITAAALYNHFSSKSVLWDAVLEHATELYLLYHKDILKALQKADSFEETLDILLDEPSRMRNLFTGYAFALIQTEQLSDKRAGEIFTGTFLEYGIAFVKDRFDSCVQRGLAQPFDTALVAALFVHNVMVAIPVFLHAHHGGRVPYDIRKLFMDFKAFLMKAVTEEHSSQMI